MAVATEGVKGMNEAMKQAAAGMKLFKEQDTVEVDSDAACKYKEEIDSKMMALDAEAAALTGKENKKMRQEKDKEKATLKNNKQYIDACKIAKGLDPVNGFFVNNPIAPAAVEAAEAPAAEPVIAATKEKKEKPVSKKESAGISKAERDELESLKNKIIDKKKALKEQGMSGGQMNKDEEIVAWVTRMNELKEKECPGSVAGGKDEKKDSKKKKVLSGGQSALVQTKQKELDEYLERLQKEFKYTKKEIAADPDYTEMKAELDKLMK